MIVAGKRDKNFFIAFNTSCYIVCSLIVIFPVTDRFLNSKSSPTHKLGIRRNGERPVVSSNRCLVLF